MPAHQKVRADSSVYIFTNGEEPIRLTPRVIAAFRARADAAIAREDAAALANAIGGNMRIQKKGEASFAETGEFARLEVEPYSGGSYPPLSVILRCPAALTAGPSRFNVINHAPDSPKSPISACMNTQDAAQEAKRRVARSLKAGKDALDLNE